MPKKPRRPYDPRAKALRAQRPPAGAVTYIPPARAAQPDHRAATSPSSASPGTSSTG